MIHYVPIELHCHTTHSDGDMTPTELLQAAIGFGYKGLVLTDHNTVSAVMEIEQTGSGSLPVLKGIEWTTYYGHMLVLGCDQIIDWREATVDTIDENIKQVRDDGAVVGIAHPFAIGNPICTGCRWDFNVQKWENIHFIEIWNSENPEKQFWSEQAYGLWIKKLREGYRMFPSAGSDWHRKEAESGRTALSYLGIDGEVTSNKIKGALQNGNLYITLGPLLNYSMKQHESEILLGNQIYAHDPLTVHCSLSETNLSALKNFKITPARILLINNENLVMQSETDELNYSGYLDKGYLRFEVEGTINGIPSKLLLSAPVYLI